MNEEPISKIKVHFNRYLFELKSLAELNLLDCYKHAEDFICRLLKRVYNWELYNVNYIDSNTVAIDLISKEKDIAIQVTALREFRKLEETLKKFMKNYEDYTKLKLFVLTLKPTDFKKKLSKEMRLKFSVEKDFLTLGTLLSEIAAKPKHEQYEILDFIEQEFIIEKTYLNRLIQIKSVNSCIEFINEQKYFTSKKYRKNNWLYYDNIELRIIKQILSQIKPYASNNKFLLIGDPCVGKTTLAYEIAEILESKKTFKSFYLKIQENINLNQLKDDFKLLNYHNAFLIVDDIHHSERLAHEILITLEQFENIKTLYLSRFNDYISQPTNFSSSVYDNFSSNKWELFHSDDGQSFSKFENIIQKRIEYLKRNYPDYKWKIGNIRNVIDSCDRNLLRLSILLYFWENELPHVELSMIKEEKFNEIFYNNHNLNQYDNSLLVKYSILYSFEIPIALAENNEGTNKIVQHGILKRINDTGFYEFQHSHYAKLILISILSRFNEFGNDINSLFTKNIADYFTDFKDKSIPSNLHLDLEKLITNNGKLIFFDLINKSNTRKKIIEFYITNNLERIYYSQLLKNILYAKDVINIEAGIEIFKALLNCRKLGNLKLFLRNDYNLYKLIIEYTNKFKVNDQVDKKIKYNTSYNKHYSLKNKNIVRIAEDIKHKKSNKELVYSILSIYNFEEWIEFIYYNPLPLISNFLSVLKKVNYSIEFAFNIYDILPTNFFIEKAKKCSFTEFGKSMSELSVFSENRSDDKLRKVIENKIICNENRINIGSIPLIIFSKGLSDLYKINRTVIKNYFLKIPESQILGLIASEQNLYTITQSLSHFLKIETKEKKSLKIVIELFQNPDFKELINNTNDLSGLNEVLIIISNIENSTDCKIEKRYIEDQMFKSLQNTDDIKHFTESLAFFYNNPQVITYFLKNSNIIVEKIEKKLEDHSLKFSGLYEIIYKLDQFNLKLANIVYGTLSINSTIKSLNVSISIHQICVTLHKIFFLKERESYMIKTKLILEAFLTNEKTKFIKRFQNQDILSQIHSYSLLFPINRVLVKQTFFNNLMSITKGECDENEFDLKNFGHIIRKLVWLGDNHRNLAKEIVRWSKKSLINTSKNLRLIEISQGLAEISAETLLKEEADELLYQIRETIISKLKKNSNIKELKTHIIPQFRQVAISLETKKFINEIKIQ